MPEGSKSIETPRLILEPYQEADRSLMAGLHMNPVVMAWMKGHVPLMPGEADALFERYLDHWRRDGLSIFAVRLKADRIFLGECGFWYRGDKPGVSMRYLLHDAYWGVGYGTEMNVAVTKWLFTETDVMSFWAVTLARNKGSIAILRRLGARLIEDRHMDVEGLHRYDVTKSDWTDAQASSPENMQE